MYSTNEPRVWLMALCLVFVILTIVYLATGEWLIAAASFGMIFLSGFMAWVCHP